MSSSLQPGDRVCVSVRNHTRLSAWRQGHGLASLRLIKCGSPYYTVAMDKDGPQSTAVHFNTDEIETEP
jgi:hypothetical protein